MQDASDDYIASLLKQEARASLNQNAGLQALDLGALATRRPNTNGRKPNLRFLNSIIRDTDNHNSALKLRELEQAGDRLRQLRGDPPRQDPRNERRQRQSSSPAGSQRHKRSRSRSRDRARESDLGRRRHVEDRGQRRRRGSRSRSPRRKSTRTSDEAQVARHGRDHGRRRKRSRSRSSQNGSDEDRHEWQGRRVKEREPSSHYYSGRSGNEDYESGSRQRDAESQTQRRSGKDDWASRDSYDRHKKRRHSRERDRSGDKNRDRPKHRDQSHVKRSRRGDRDDLSQDYGNERDGHRHSRDESREHLRALVEESVRRRKTETEAPSRTRQQDDSAIIEEHFSPKRRSQDDYGRLSPGLHPRPGSTSSTARVEPLVTKRGRGAHTHSSPPVAAQTPDTPAANNSPGPQPESPQPVIRRGRGAHTASESAMDARFLATYDPKTDMPSAGTGDDWDFGLEAVRNRALFQKIQGDRLRAAGFSAEEVEKWERGRKEEDVVWRSKAEGREWDRGKVVQDDGTIAGSAEWAGASD